MVEEKIKKRETASKRIAFAQHQAREQKPKAVMHIPFYAKKHTRGLQGKLSVPVRRFALHMDP